MKNRIDVSHFLFLCAYLLGMFDAVVLGLSTFSDIPHSSTIGWGLRGVAAVFILLKLILDSRYTLGSLIYAVGAGLLLMVSFLLSKYNHLFYLLLAVLGMRHIRVRSVVRADIVVRMTLVIVIVFCALTGVIENYATYRTGSSDIRYSMGFYHPNTLASMVFLIVLEESWLSRRRFSVLYMLFIWAACIVVYIITVNRTSVLLLALYPLIMLIFMGFRPRESVSPRLRISAQALFPLLVVICYVAMELSRQGGLFTLLDRLMSRRFYNCKALFDHYGIAPLGQYVDLSSGDLGRYFGIYVALLDVAYLRTLLQAGPLVLALMGWMHICAVGYAGRIQDRYTVMIICVLAIFGVSESLYNNVFMNFSLLFGAGAAFFPLDGLPEDHTPIREAASESDMEMDNESESEA